MGRTEQAKVVRGVGRAAEHPGVHVIHVEKARGRAPYAVMGEGAAPLIALPDLMAYSPGNVTSVERG